MDIKKDFPLKQYNTFGIDAKCDFFAEFRDIDTLKQLLLNPGLTDLEKLVLGGGSNILFTKDFPGLVLKNSLKGIEIIKENDDHIWVKSGAGEIWHELVLYCINRNYAGIENLSLIPGLTGAAPMQNIGAYGVELKSVFENLEALRIKDGKFYSFKNADCEFGYRESIFKKSLKGQFIITSVTLRLNKKPAYNISYGAIQQTLEEHGIKELSIKAISDAVISIRQSKLPDPQVIGNAGSFFKNPEIPAQTYVLLSHEYPEMPNYKLPDEMVKIPAGWLIEQCGWKGKKVGNTGSHINQSLVLVNYGQATGEEIKDLAFKIQNSVKEKFGIELNPEVNII